MSNMMCHAIGILKEAPRQTVTKNGKPMVTFRLECETGFNGKKYFKTMSCVTFSASIIESLKTLSVGDRLLVSGDASADGFLTNDGKPAAVPKCTVNYCANLGKGVLQGTMPQQVTMQFAPPPPAPAQDTFQGYQQAPVPMSQQTAEEPPTDVPF